VEIACYYLIYSALMLVWMLPISLTGLEIEHTFGFSNQTVWLLLKDELIGLAVNSVAIPLIWLAFRLYTYRPKSWWQLLWAVMTPLIAFSSVIYPVVVAPLYNRYTPLGDTPLRGRILALATKAGIEHSRVFVENTSLRTSHVNAYVTGIGPSTRIVINDTALHQLPDDQILAMVGHEIGHYMENHVLINAAISVVGTGGLLWLLSLLLPRLAARYAAACKLRGLNDPAALPLVFLALILLNLAFQPVSSALSRTMEHRADAYGLRLTGLNDATARLMVGFAERDLSDPNPPRLLHLWFGTHPTLLERIAYARRFHPL
jgi:Zn-dependent protease with chaperone function